MIFSVALKFYSSVRLDVRKKDAVKDGGVIIGNKTAVKVVKNKLAPPFRTAEFEIIFGQGISKEGSLVDLAIEKGVLQKSGSWISYNDEKIGQGREKVIALLKTNPDLYNEIEALVKEKLDSAN